MYTVRDLTLDSLPIPSSYSSRQQTVNSPFRHRNDSSTRVSPRRELTSRSPPLPHPPHTPSTLLVPPPFWNRLGTPYSHSTHFSPPSYRVFFPVVSSSDPPLVTTPHKRLGIHLRSRTTLHSSPLSTPSSLSYLSGPERLF